MELATTAATAVASASRPHGPFSPPPAVSVSVSWASPSLASTSLSLSTSSSASTSRRRRRWLPVASAAVELREAAAGGGDSVRVTETPQPGSSVSPRLRCPFNCGRSRESEGQFELSLLVSQFGAMGAAGVVWVTEETSCLIFNVRLCDSSQVKFSVEVPTSIIQECYQLTLQEYAKRFKVPFLCKLQTLTPESDFGIHHCPQGWLCHKVYNAQ